MLSAVQHTGEPSAATLMSELSAVHPTGQKAVNLVELKRRAVGIEGDQQGAGLQQVAREAQTNNYPTGQKAVNLVKLKRRAVGIVGDQQGVGLQQQVAREAQTNNYLQGRRLSTLLS